jgi:CoA-transferase family III
MRLPLAGIADRMLAKLAAATGSKAIAALDGMTLLCERAILGGMKIPGRISAGGGCQLFDALDHTIAINLARPADRELLPALFATEALDPYDDKDIAARIAASEPAALVSRGRSMGLAVASECEVSALRVQACSLLTPGCPTTTERKQSPRVLDLSSLWAGPLAAHLLWLAGADVVKVESRERPDAIRGRDEAFHGLLNQGKARVVLSLRDTADRQLLLSLIGAADIVIESARPRALAQLGIDAAQIVRSTPGLVWVSITAHGAEGDAANWIGFGDDCGVAGGLTAALHRASGISGFVGDAIADPLTGIETARVAWDAWTSRGGGRFALAMSHIVAHAVSAAHGENPAEFASALRAWRTAAGQPFPSVQRRQTRTYPQRSGFSCA